MVNAARFQSENFRGKQSAEPDRSGRADDDLGESPALHVVDNFQHGRKAELLQFVFGQFEFADRGKIHDRNVARGHLAARGGHGQVESLGTRRRGHSSYGSRNPVDIFQRVSEPDAPMVAQALRDIPAGSFAEGSQLPASGRTESVEIRGETEREGHERADKLQAFDQPSGLQLRDELGKEAEGELVDQQVGGEEGAAFRCHHPLGCFLDGRAHARLAHRIGQLFPQGRIARKRHLPNLSGGNALRKKTQLLGESEPRGIFALHETSGHSLKQGRGGLLGVLRQTLTGKLEYDTVETVGHDERTAPFSAGKAPALAHRGEECAGGITGRLGPSAPLIHTPFVVGTAGEHLAPRLVPERFQFEPFGKPRGVPRSQPRERKFGRLAKQRIAQSIDRLKVPEEKNQALPVVEGEPFVDRPERMRHSVRDILRLEPRSQGVNVPPQGLYLMMLRLGDPPGEEVHFNVILGKKCGNFFTDEGPRLPRDLETTVNRVVVRERDEIKTLFTQDAVKLPGRGAAGREIHLAQEPVGGPCAVSGMEVEISASHETLSA